MSDDKISCRALLNKSSAAATILLRTDRPFAITTSIDVKDRYITTAPMQAIELSVIAVLSSFRRVRASAAGLAGQPLKVTVLALLLILHGQVFAADDELPRGKFREAATVIEMAGEEWAMRFQGMVDPDKKVRWSIFVPETYDPDSPAGLMIYISPSNSGRIPRKWQSVMKDQNLIWIGADRSGNSVDPRARMAYSLLAPMHIGKKYNIDGSRIYISGLSGGGRVASLVAPEYPMLFRGAIFICGTNQWENQTSQKVADLQNSRFVFLTGSDDFNRRETRKIYNEYLESGFENGLYMEIPNMGHENPTAKNLTRAIAYLDAR